MRWTGLGWLLRLAEGMAVLGDIPSHTIAQRALVGHRGLVWTDPPDGRLARSVQSRQPIAPTGCPQDACSAYSLSQTRCSAAVMLEAAGDVADFGAGMQGRHIWTRQSSSC